MGKPAGKPQIAEQKPSTKVADEPKVESSPKPAATVAKPTAQATGIEPRVEPQHTSTDRSSYATGGSSRTPEVARNKGGDGSNADSTPKPAGSRPLLIPTVQGPPPKVRQAVERPEKRESESESPQAAWIEKLRQKKEKARQALDALLVTFGSEQDKANI